MNRRFFVSAFFGLAAGLSLATGCATGPPADPCLAGPEFGCLTDEQIEAMPLLERPDRPGHCVGNTIRAIDRWLNGYRGPDECDPCP